MPYADPESGRAYDRAYHQANRERKNEARRARRAANPEQHKAYCRAWREANRKHALAYGRAWRAANREHHTAYNRVWYAANRDHVNALRRSREAAKRSLRPAREVPRLTEEQWRRLDGLADRIWSPLVAGTRGIRAYVRCVRYTGASWASLRRLRWDDVNFALGTLTLPVRTGEPKVVPLLPPLRKELETLRLWDSNGPVLHPYSREHFAQTFRRLVRQIGLPGLRFDDLRAGVDLSGVREAVTEAIPL